VKNARPGFAIIGIDPDQDSEQNRVTVKRVVWDEALAESEVQRLNELNADAESFYFWQYTRVDKLRSRAE
jgi:hypothetical protein